MKGEENRTGFLIDVAEFQERINIKSDFIEVVS